MIKRLKYIFISVLAVLLMSHNVFAVSNTNIPLSNNIVTYQGNVYGSTNFVRAETNTYDPVTGYNIGKNELNFLQFNTPSAINYKDYTSYVFNFRLVTDYNFTPVSNNNFPISEYYITNNDCSDIDSSFNTVVYCYTVVIKGKLKDSSPNGYFILGRYNEHSRLLQYFAGGVEPTDSNFSNTYIVSPELKLFISESESAADYSLEKEKAETQDAADDSSTAGGTSSSDATSATSSLLSVIGAGIGAITTASPTNCRINADMGNLDIGNIDLCANPVPAFIAVIGSIIAVLVVLPLVIVLFNRFISIIRSFQG